MTSPAPSADAATLAADADTGGRAPVGGLDRRALWIIPLVWALFQLWIAAPLRFEWVPFWNASPLGDLFQLRVWNDTQTRAIHLAFAVFLAYVAFPTTRRSPRDWIPPQDWALGLIAATTCAYIWLAYDGLAARTGAPSQLDVAMGAVGVALLLEAARRSLGFPLMAVAVVALAYIFFGSWAGLPEVIRWQGASINKAVSHLWLTTEGVFGIAIGVSSSFVFLFVLFGALLNQAGAGNYFVQIAFSLLGHLRGGPAKAAVASSAMTGLISGSSIANVVTTGTFTIPLMKRVGFSPAKAGAVEVSSSVNGVLTPPVMGAVAFLMTEYVGVTYIEVVRAAIVPALISYIALVYIVHLEALKQDLRGLDRPQPIDPLKARMIRGGITISSLFILAFVVYWLVEGLKIALGDGATWPLLGLLLAAYVGLVAMAAQRSDLALDDPNQPIVTLPSFAKIGRSGVYYVLPIIVLVWFLIIERASAGMSAFWATVFMILILVTQKPLKALFRGQSGVGAALAEGVRDLGDGLISGARNMIGLAAAMGVAGIIVGAVTLTGVGQVMAEFVEYLSGGNLLLMLFFVALISIILGMGLPTTANYIVVASLMANVVVELGAQSGLAVPLIAVHMFVFYYGIMADVTPPVGLASFAAAAISRADPIKTGFTAFFYSLRTALLPFLFIFNTDLLLIDVGPAQAVFVFIIALIAMLLFAAGTMGYFLTRSRWYESAALLLAAFVLFRPDYLLDRVQPPYVVAPAAEVFALAEAAPDDGEIRLMLEGESLDGDFVSATFLMPLGPAGADGAARLDREAGLAFVERDGALLVDSIMFGKPAEQAGIDFDWTLTGVERETNRMPQEVFYIPAFALLTLVVVAQRRRRRRALVLNSDE